jgi:ribonuclease-3
MSTPAADSLAALVRQFGLEPCPAVLPLLRRAMIHRSHRTEAGLAEDNELLEFLGDSVIGLATTRFLCLRFPTSTEGDLTKCKAMMVSRAALDDVAATLGLAPLVLLGVGEERSGGRSRPGLLGSVLEAVVGALYLVYPWAELEPALVRTIVDPAFRNADSAAHARDPKSALQEWAQARWQRGPEYRLVETVGPEHDRWFVVEVWMNDRLLGRGRGRRKQLAEKAAASEALRLVIEQPQ